MFVIFPAEDLISESYLALISHEQREANPTGITSTSHRTEENEAEATFTPIRIDDLEPRRRIVLRKQNKYSVMNLITPEQDELDELQRYEGLAKASEMCQSLSVTTTSDLAKQPFDHSPIPKDNKKAPITTNQLGLHRAKAESSPKDVRDAKDLTMEFELKTFQYELQRQMVRLGNPGVTLKRSKELNNMSDNANTVAEDYLVPTAYSSKNVSWKKKTLK